MSGLFWRIVTWPSGLIDRYHDLGTIINVKSNLLIFNFTTDGMDDSF